MKENVRQFIGMQIDEVLIYSSNEQIHDYHFYDYNCSYHDSMTRAIKSSVSLKFKLNMPWENQLQKGFHVGQMLSNVNDHNTIKFC